MSLPPWCGVHSLPRLALTVVSKAPRRKVKMRRVWEREADCLAARSLIRQISERENQPAVRRRSRIT